MNVDLIAGIVFVLAITLFLVVKRKNIEIQKIAFPIFYFIMYKTRIGLNAMDRLAKRHPRFIDYFVYGAIAIGFLGIIAISVLLIYNLFRMALVPEAVPGVGLVLPVKVKGAFFVPFFYWIISILIIASVHEFCHGMVARRYNLRIKSSGFAFLALIFPVIPAAFVEPDEKEIKKRPHKEQLGIFSAGPFANIILGLIMLALLGLIAPPFIDATMQFSGVNITEIVNGSPVSIANISVGEKIFKIDDKNISYLEDFSEALENKSPGSVILLRTDKGEYNVTLGKNPRNESKAWLGLSVLQSREFKEDAKKKYGIWTLDAITWIIGLFYWLYLLNIGIGIFNLVPVGPIDGGRIAQLLFHRIFSKKKGNRIFKYVSAFFLFIIIANLLIGFAK